MGKIYIVLIFVIATLVSCAIYIFFISSPCSEYGGFVGVKHNCNCMGIEVTNIFREHDFSRGRYFSACLGFAKVNAELGAKNPNCYKKVDAGNCKACSPAYEYHESQNICVKKCNGGCQQGYIPFHSLETCEAECVR
ncbi:MAG: hypothetical protein U0525_04220 [Patescibacteria group bacterium]